MQKRVTPQIEIPHGLIHFDDDLIFLSSAWVGICYVPALLQPLVQSHIDDEANSLGWTLPPSPSSPIKQHRLNLYLLVLWWFLYWGYQRKLGCERVVCILDRSKSSGIGASQPHLEAFWSPRPFQSQPSRHVSIEQAPRVWVYHAQNPRIHQDHMMIEQYPQGFASAVDNSYQWFIAGYLSSQSHKSDGSREALTLVPIITVWANEYFYLVLSNHTNSIFDLIIINLSILGVHTPTRYTRPLNKIHSRSATSQPLV